ncbi:hypothetical protein EMCRGX_G004946 [Ephydatia muelleri]
MEIERILEGSGDGEMAKIMAVLDPVQHHEDEEIEDEDISAESAVIRIPWLRLLLKCLRRAKSHSIAIMSQAAIRMSGPNSEESLDAVIIRASQGLGYSSVRDKQLLAIRTFMEGNDVFISLPTASGKSLCYAVLPSPCGSNSCHKEKDYYHSWNGRPLCYCIISRQDKCCADCAMLYKLFQSQLKKEFTEPIGAPNISRFRLVDMFTSVTDKEVQDSIISSFCKSDTCLRVVICSIAFGMGLDCRDVIQVIHWGPPSNLEAYMQECGRAGRSGSASSAVLYVRPADLSSPTISMT